MKRVVLLAFPQEKSAELCVQLGRVAPDMPVEVYESFSTEHVPLDAETLLLLWDSPVAMGQANRLFQAVPEISLVVLSAASDADRASDLMRVGAMDYRVLPCPDEVFEIYLRGADHRSELNRQSKELQASCDTFVTADIATRRLLDQVALVAPSKASVFVIGESGTGKERMARYIHQCSDRKDAAFVAVNCAAIPEGMLEAELFGHEKGAFTGAVSARAGKFELAHGGTLLLDEITEMPIHLQAKLLRVLQEEEVDRLGGRAPVKVDVRVIATSNRDLTQSVTEGNFRQDLFYRLNVVNVQIPPLRQRVDDILPLARHFLTHFSEMYGKPVPEVGDDAVRALGMHDWPGNVRELENCMHRAFLVSGDAPVSSEHLGLMDGMVPSGSSGDDASSEVKAGMSIRDMERALIEKTVVHVKGNRQEAAKLLGISIRTLRNKLHEYEAGTDFAKS
ncbi:MAG TPA: sigma-54 dependent transcriptional regulator [Mariprofundaceae bacterium]|nr:sigma-54 dependent transcriptional regulator [Mariprofundaceae bacterium]